MINKMKINKLKIRDITNIIYKIVILLVLNFMHAINSWFNNGEIDKIISQ